MTRLTKRLGPIALALAIALPGAASAQQYFCTVAATNGNSWIPTEFLIEYSGSSATITHGWVDGPVSHQMQIRGNTTQRRLNYSVADVGARTGQRTTMAFRLTHNMASGQLQVRMDPVQYSNSFSGSGTCVPT